MKREKSCGALVIRKNGEQYDLVLLRHRFGGHWSFPKGHVEDGEHENETALREVKEETGLDAEAIRVIALQDRNRHNKPVYAYGVCKVFVLCAITGGAFAENSETTEIRFFSLEELPANLAEEKTTREQIEMCFKAFADENWRVQFD